MNTLRWYSGSCDENRKCGTEHEDNGKETERKAKVTMAQQHQQPPGGKETERKAKVTMAQQHQPPGGKEHQPQSSFKRWNGARTVQEPYRMEEVSLLPH